MHPLTQGPEALKQLLDVIRVGSVVRVTGRVQPPLPASRPAVVDVVCHSLQVVDVVDVHRWQQRERERQWGMQQQQQQQGQGQSDHKQHSADGKRSGSKDGTGGVSGSAGAVGQEVGQAPQAAAGAGRSYWRSPLPASAIMVGWAGQSDQNGHTFVTCLSVA